MLRIHRQKQTTQEKEEILRGQSLHSQKRKRHRDNATDGKPREERPYG